jgi:hypothetical protein
MHSPTVGRRSYVYSKGIIHGRICPYYARLGSPIFTTNVGEQMKILMWSLLTISIDSFPWKSGLELYETVSYDLTFHRHVLVFAIFLILFQHAKVDYWMICPSVRVFTCGNNTTALDHATVMKWVNGCPKIILVAGVKLQFYALHGHLTSICSIFNSEEILKPHPVPENSIPGMNFGVELNNLEPK